MRLLFALLISVSFVYAGKPPVLWFRMQDYYEVSNATRNQYSMYINNDVFGQSFSNAGKFQAAMFCPLNKTNAKKLTITNYRMTAETSIGFWFWPWWGLSGTTVAPNTGTHFFLGYPSSGRTFIMYAANGTGLDCYVYDKAGNNTRLQVVNASFSASNWHYMLMTISDTTKLNQFRIWIDGALVTNLATGKVTGTNTNAFDIGMLASANNQGSDAWIDNFMIWDYILSTNEHLRARSSERGAFNDN